MKFRKFIASSVLLYTFSNSALAYHVVDGIQFPLEDYSVGCNGYWDTCVAKWHLGEDVGVSAGTKVYAIAAGKVKEARNATRYGGLYLIEHMLPSGEKVVSLYGHLDQETFTKKVGDDVEKGQYLGKVGTFEQNGGWSEHLHFGIHKGEYKSEYDCAGSWTYAGYTTCESSKDDWYQPSDFVKNVSTIRYKCSLYEPYLPNEWELCWGYYEGQSAECEDGFNWTLDNVQACTTDGNNEVHSGFCSGVTNMQIQSRDLAKQSRSKCSSDNPPITSPSPQPIDGKLVDLNIDFDIESEDGHEISASSDTYIPKTVEVGDDIRLIL